MNSVTIHHRNLQNLGIEIKNVKNNLSPIITHGIFPHRNYNGQEDFELPHVNSTRKGQETLRVMGHKNMRYHSRQSKRIFIVEYF